MPSDDASGDNQSLPSKEDSIISDTDEDTSLDSLCSITEDEIEPCNVSTAQAHVNPLLTIAYTNAQSIMNKIEELRLVAAVDKPDIIALTESWTNEMVEQCVLSIDGYHTPVRQDRKDTKDGRGGGVLLYVKSCMTFSEITPNAKFTNSVWIKLTHVNGDKVIVGLVYRSPNSSADNNSGLVSTMNEMCQTNNQVIIVGDFNFPSINWELLTADNSSEFFLTCIQDEYLTQHVSFPTRKSNILDLVFTSELEMCNNIVPMGYLGGSDHVFMNITVNIKISINNSSQKIPDYGRANFTKLREDLSKPAIQEICNIESTSEAWRKFEAEVRRAMRRHIPMKQRKSRNRPSLGRPVVRALRRKRKLWKKCLSSNEDRDLVELKKAEQILKSKTNEAKRNIEKNIAFSSKKKPKVFHQYVRSVLKTKAAVGPLVNSQGHLLESDAEAADELNRYFSSVFTIENMENFPEVTQEFDGENELRSANFTTSEVQKKVDSLDANKTSGPDDISVRVLKEIVPTVICHLTRLFNRMVGEACVPQNWKEANVTPIHKKGPKCQPCNYRPVSLTSQLCKLVESLLRDRIVAHLDDHELIRSSQHGFRKKRSCVSNLLAFLDEATACVDKGSAADVIYLDYRKAFDKVPHQRLLQKLEAHGIVGNILDWIRCWLTGRRQRVVLNGEVSLWSKVSSGVPQGSVLGPVLFLVYINDLDLGINGTIYKFADDTKLFKEVTCVQEVTEMQEDIRALECWSEKWQMEFNTGKCKVMHLGHNNPMAEYAIQGETLEAVQEEKDLGVVVSCDLKSAKQCAEAVKKANRTLGTIKRCFKHKTVDIIKQLYLSHVRPHLEFAIQAWSPQYEKDKKLMEGVQRRATKLAKSERSKDYGQRLEAFGLTTLEERRRRGDLIEVHKIISDEKYCNGQLFERSHNTHTRGHSLKLKKPKSRVNARSHYFANRVVDNWNGLTEEVVTAADTNSFKRCYDRLQKTRGAVVPQPEENAPGAENRRW